eukprot:1140731-Pelagomonas_calceolata.AAC.7
MHIPIIVLQAAARLRKVVAGRAHTNYLPGVVREDGAPDLDEVQGVRNQPREWLWRYCQKHAVPWLVAAFQSNVLYLCARLCPFLDSANLCCPYVDSKRSCMACCCLLANVLYLCEHLCPFCNSLSRTQQVLLRGSGPLNHGACSFKLRIAPKTGSICCASLQQPLPIMCVFN